VDPFIGEIIKQGAGAGPLGTLSDAWQAIIGDRVAAWRLKNAMALQAKASQEARRLGLSLNAARIPERYAFAWFEEATKQDEPEIQQLFARLLARAAAGDDDASDRRLLEILTRLTPMDATVMDWMFRNTADPADHPRWDEKAVWKSVRDLWGASSSLSVEHLITLGVFERSFALKPNSQHLQEWSAGDIRNAVVQGRELDVELLATETGMSLHRALAPIAGATGE
jgi:hypothetical protein